MDDQNIETLTAQCPKENIDKVRLFLSFSPTLNTREVPDPYYGGPDGFGDVFDMIGTASEGLFADIRTHHSNALS